MLTDFWHEVELECHGNDVEADDAGDGEVEVLADGDAVEQHARLAVQRPVRNLVTTYTTTQLPATYCSHDHTSKVTVNDVRPSQPHNTRQRTEDIASSPGISIFKRKLQKLRNTRMGFFLDRRLQPQFSSRAVNISIGKQVFRTGVHFSLCAANKALGNYLCKTNFNTKYFHKMH